jgi:hypothetical protein
LIRSHGPIYEHTSFKELIKLLEVLKCIKSQHDVVFFYKLFKGLQAASSSKNNVWMIQLHIQAISQSMMLRQHIRLVILNLRYKWQSYTCIKQGLVEQPFQVLIGYWFGWKMQSLSRKNAWIPPRKPSHFERCRYNRGGDELQIVQSHFWLQFVAPMLYNLWKEIKNP